MLPAGEIESVGSALIELANGDREHADMHLLEGENEQEIRARLEQALDTFFEFFPEV